jgi:hypothetical protein
MINCSATTAAVEFKSKEEGKVKLKLHQSSQIRKIAVGVFFYGFFRLMLLPVK